MIVPPVAKHPCICRHRWNPNPDQGPCQKKGHALGQFTVIAAENVTALSGVSFPSDKGVTVLKSITIPDEVNVALLLAPSPFLVVFRTAERLVKGRHFRAYGTVMHLMSLPDVVSH